LQYFGTLELNVDRGSSSQYQSKTSTQTNNRQLTYKRRETNANVLSKNMSNGYLTSSTKK